jgi:hypothetical protein
MKNTLPITLSLPVLLLLSERKATTRFRGCQLSYLLKRHSGKSIPLIFFERHFLGHIPERTSKNLLEQDTIRLLAHGLALKLFCFATCFLLTARSSLGQA